VRACVYNGLRCSIHRGVFPDHGERAVAGDRPRSLRSQDKLRHCRERASPAPTNAAKRLRLASFAQILGKLNFFKLGENLQRILFDYAEKRASTTNPAFKCTC
jgi:hypothetical protein